MYTNIDISLQDIFTVFPVIQKFKWIHFQVEKGQKTGRRDDLKASVLVRWIRNFLH